MANVSHHRVLYHDNLIVFLHRHIVKDLTGLALHPLYIINYVVSLRTLLSHKREVSFCFFEELIRYRIVEVEWIDKTPKTTSTIASALGHVHNGFLNVFEGAMSLVG